LRRFHIPDTSTNTAGDSTGANLHATEANLYTASAEATSAATTTVRATRSTATACDAKAFRYVHSWQSKARDDRCA